MLGFNSKRPGLTVRTALANPLASAGDPVGVTAMPFKGAEGNGSVDLFGVPP